jgi:hypothetical protein
MADKFKKRFDQAVELFDQGKAQEGSDLMFELAKEGHLDSVEQLVYIFLDQKDFTTVEDLIQGYSDHNDPTILYLKARLVEEKVDLEAAGALFLDAANAGSPNACASLVQLNIENGLLDEANKWLKKARKLEFWNIVELEKDLIAAAQEVTEEPIPAINLSEFVYAGDLENPSGQQIIVDPSYLEADFLREIVGEIDGSDEGVFELGAGMGYFRKSSNKISPVFVQYLAGEDKRIASILICDDPNSYKKGKLKVSKREQISFEDLDQLGLISVDSGQIIVADLEALKKFAADEDWNVKESTTGLNYRIVSDISLSSQLQGIVENVFVVATGFGDGRYNVYLFIDSEKREYLFLDFLNFPDE